MKSKMLIAAAVATGGLALVSMSAAGSQAAVGTVAVPIVADSSTVIHSGEASATVACPAGHRVTGGGFTVLSLNPADGAWVTDSATHVHYSAPTSTGSGWNAKVDNGVSNQRWKLRVHAICES
ncbi:hypothetical protein [Streptomyces virginiae]|uniref:hypothetical protein n=1 Tax=Streptomyces virginiae TaxID=1961 RepID=UPI0034372C1B